jgi:hypothetical protein
LVLDSYDGLQIGGLDGVDAISYLKEETATPEVCSMITGLYASPK